MRLPPVIEKLLDEIAQKEGFSNYKFEVESGPNRGDNYQGIMITVQLVGDRVKDGVVANAKLDLICKVTPESKERRDLFTTPLLFEREIHMYTHVLPILVKFQQEKGISPNESFLSFPKLYAWVADKESETYALIMGDLRSEGFAMWPKQAPVTWELEELIYKQLGRFHGVSFAMKDQRPEVFAEFQGLNDFLTSWFESDFFGGIMHETIERALNVLEKEEHKNMVKRFRKQFQGAWKICFSEKAVEKFGIVGHGDNWISNLMFQYSNSVCIKQFFSLVSIPVIIFYIFIS